MKNEKRILTKPTQKKKFSNVNKYTQPLKKKKIDPCDLIQTFNFYDAHQMMCFSFLMNYCANASIDQ